MKATTSPALAHLAATLAGWVEDQELKACCNAWAAFRGGEAAERPAPTKGKGQAFRDSDYWVFSEALACVKMGLVSRAMAHTERVERRMRQTPVLNRYSLAVRVGTPQVRDGKE